MTQRQSLRSQLYRRHATSATSSRPPKGPGAYAKRRVRRKVYAKSNGALRVILRAFGL